MPPDRQNEIRSLTRRKNSVKDLTSKFTGSSVPETEQSFQAKVRKGKMVPSATTEELKNFGSGEKKRFMREWAMAIRSRGTDEKVTTETARSFLVKNCGINEETLRSQGTSGEQAWKEWIEAIETVARSGSPVDERLDKSPIPFKTYEIKSPPRSSSGISWSGSMGPIRRASSMDINSRDHATHGGTEDTTFSPPSTTVTDDARDDLREHEEIQSSSEVDEWLTLSSAKGHALSKLGHEYNEALGAGEGGSSHSHTSTDSNGKPPGNISVRKEKHGRKHACSNFTDLAVDSATSVGGHDDKENAAAEPRIHKQKRPSFESVAAAASPGNVLTLSDPSLCLSSSQGSGFVAGSEEMSSIPAGSASKKAAALKSSASAVVYPVPSTMHKSSVMDAIERERRDSIPIEDSTEDNREDQSPSAASAGPQTCEGAEDSDESDNYISAVSRSQTGATDEHKEQEEDEDKGGDDEDEKERDDMNADTTDDLDDAYSEGEAPPSPDTPEGAFLTDRWASPPITSPLSPTPATKRKSAAMTTNPPHETTSTAATSGSRELGVANSGTTAAAAAAGGSMKSWAMAVSLLVLLAAAALAAVWGMGAHPTVSAHSFSSASLPHIDATTWSAVGHTDSAPQQPAATAAASSQVVTTITHMPHQESRAAAAKPTAAPAAINVAILMQPIGIKERK